MPKRIVYTRHDGGVAICSPSATALTYMTGGGGRWDGFDPGFLDRQIAQQARDGVGERAAQRFVMAMQFGGCTTAEANEIMRDRYCAHLGTGCELWDQNDIPQDRWFRDAWRRSHNGGPICVDMQSARRIQRARLADFSEQQRVDLSWPRWRERIRRAQTPEALKATWPKLRAPRIIVPDRLAA